MATKRRKRLRQKAAEFVSGQHERQVAANRRRLDELKRDCAERRARITAKRKKQEIT